MRAHCKKVIDEVAQDGGYVMDASAIMQDDTSVENLRAMTEAAREYGVYSDGVVKVADDDELKVGPAEGTEFGSDYGMISPCGSLTPAGQCFPWAEKVKEISEIKGDAEIAERICNELDGLANMYIWQCLLSF